MSVQGKVVGVAHDVQDVVLLARRHGVELDVQELNRTPLIEWRGGGSAAWGLSEQTGPGRGTSLVQLPDTR
ncbi:hypothetical protein [Streptomyces sp. enrichment culture]|uniref:hypothetical protein n=1 Tax=Streptomyces sp. enrichment culture TaxID=1795815 RepID=UPI003F55D2EB